MSNINLLPWREAFKKDKQKVFISRLIMGLVISLILSYIGMMYADALIDNQKRRNKYMEIQISILDKRIAEIAKIKKDKEKVEHRIVLIQQLEKERNHAIALFNRLPKITPEGVYINKLSFFDHKIKITGESDSNTYLTDMMRKIEYSKKLETPYLSSIVADADPLVKQSKFIMDFSMIPEPEPGEDSNGLK